MAYPKHGRQGSSGLPSTPQTSGTPAATSSNPKRFVQPESRPGGTPLVAQAASGYPNSDLPNRSKDGDTVLPNDDQLITGTVQTGAGAQPATTNVTPSATRFGVTNP